MMQKINDFLVMLDGYIGGHPWFVILLLGTGIFFTIYLRFPQFRFFRHAIDIVRGKYDHHLDVGDTSHFQALSTALSGTVGTGNIAGVALAIHLGGPAALFWMLVTAAIGMCTKMVEVTISHKYRDVLPDGTISGGPMYYMKKRLNIKTKSGKIIKTGAVIGAFFAVATVLSSFGTGSLPQINSISNAVFSTFGINQIITGAILSFVLALIIIGGIKRIARVTEKLVPGMAIFYFIGAILVIATNYQNIIPSVIAIFSTVFTGTAAVGGFLGASVAFAINRGVNRGLFSNESGQGSAPIAHSAARAPEPVSEGLVALLEPFIDTIIICSLTGLTILTSGVWHEKVDNQFQSADMTFLAGSYDEKIPDQKQKIVEYIRDGKALPLFSGTLKVNEGMIEDNITLIASRSVAEDYKVYDGKNPFSGEINVVNGKWQPSSSSVYISGKSLVHSAPLTTEAFKKSILGDWGKYVVAIGLLLFAFSTAVSWSYYGDRAITYLVGPRYVIYYRFVYVAAFFIASFTDTTIVWSLSYITIALMTVPNLIGLWILRKEIKQTISDYWTDLLAKHPEDKKLLEYVRKDIVRKQGK
ncbi:MAG TPA: sodium:alanine symporter family protein [Bacteroidales bacterium]|nr:sodium:alanine symporter family protein [Bacteroidales bacterium]HRT90119.1 sodium:alanine symporter family protein [Bacteroidales bacterium]